MSVPVHADGTPAAGAKRRPVSAELELLLCCARLRLGSPHHARITQLLREGIDWVRLVRGAKWHRLYPLLFSHLQKLADEVHCQDALAYLREACDSNARRTLQLTAELLELVRLFQGANIPAVPYKGPLLAAQVYGSVALRHAGDLDIVVRKRDMMKARELLLTRGYAVHRQATDARQAYCEEFIGRDRIQVELHWAFTKRDIGFRLPLEELLPRLARTRIGGVWMPTLATQDLLVALCVHGAKHQWERLEWLCGVAELMRARDPHDWTGVLEHATQLRGRRALLLGTYLAHDLLDAPLPESMVDEARRSRGVGSLIHEAQRRLLWEFPGNESRPVAALPDKLFQAGLADRLRDRLRYRFCRPLARRLAGWQYAWLHR